jgi:hypothetical protein
MFNFRKERYAFHEHEFLGVDIEDGEVESAVLN